MINDTKGSILVSNEICGYGIGRTHQYGDVLIKKRLRPARSDVSNNGKIRSLTETGIPLYSGGPKKKAHVADPGREGGFYCKATQEFGYSDKAAFAFFRGILKRHSNTGPQGISQKKGAWSGSVLKGTSSFSTVMIDWQIINFRRFIDCWFRRRFGRFTEMSGN